MLSYMKEGWRATARQPFLVLTLFLYRFVWGFVLYKLAQSVILPLLYRHPGSLEGVPESQLQLFLAEGQFQLFKTDISHSYLWLLIVLLLVRMVLTPLLNAGVYFSMANTRLNAGYRFVRGIRELSGSFLPLYAVQMVLTLAPLYFLYPMAAHALSTARTYEALLWGVLPYLLGMLVYGYLLHLVFMYLQFGKAWSAPLSRALGTILRSLSPVLGMSLLLLAVILVLSVLVMGAALYWAGFWSLLLYQAFRFVQTLFSLWTIASQHQLFKARTDLF